MALPKVISSTSKDHGPEAELTMIALAFALKKFVKKKKFKVTRKEWEAFDLHGTTVALSKRGNTVRVELME